MSLVSTPASAQIDAHAVVGALLHDAVKAEDFEKAVKYRQYRSCLDELQAAIASEQFDKCVDIKKRKLALESELPELETKKKQMEAQLALDGSTSAELKKTVSSSSSLSMPNKTAFISPLSPDAAANLAAVKERLWNTKSPADAKAAVAANNSQSDESDESLVKGGARATAAAQARVDKALAGAGSNKAAPAAPAKKLTAAELEARWAKIAPRAQATAKNVRGEGQAATDDAVGTKTKRTSWDGGFTVQAAPGAAGADGDDSSEEEQSRQTLDESEDVVVDKKSSSSSSRTVGDAVTAPKKKKKKVKKGSDKEKEKAAKKKKQMQMMRSTWAVDVGGASLVELAKKKNSAKPSKTKKTKKKKTKLVTAPEVLVLSTKSSATNSPSSLKNSNVAFDGDEDTDLIQPKSAIKGGKSSSSSFTGGLSRAADAPDADSARKAYEQRLASARESQRAAEKDVATPEKKTSGISLFGRKK
jgi:hypothetical protein